MLKPKIFIIMILTVTLISVFGKEQKKNIEVTKLKKNVYRLTSKIPYSTNFLAYVSKDGILLVDSGQQATGDEIRNVLKEIAPENHKIKYLINTHAHKDHTGGNFALAGEPVIIGSSLLKKTLLSYSYVLMEFPDNALPQILFEDQMTLEFGGEVFKLYSIPGSHDQTDIMVHLVKSKIVCLGDVSYGMSFPSADNYTGNFLKYPEVINRALSLIPEDVIIFSGHGRESSVVELRQYRDMISGTINLVKGEIAKGNTVDKMIKEDFLKDWAAYGKGVAGSRNSWIWQCANAGPSKIIGSLAGELCKVLKNENADKAIDRYYELKKNFPGSYGFKDKWHLYKIGKWLMDKHKRIDDAIKIFKLMEREFSDYWYAYDRLGEGYMRNGNKKLAILNFKKSLKLKPKNKNAQQKLEELKKNNMNYMKKLN